MSLVHYDCDPGQDDAVALLYALASPGIDIGSVSVVGGNALVAQCAYNALRILHLAGRDDIPVYEGAQNPLCRPLVTLPQVFGPDGMAGGENLPAPSRGVEAQSAVDYLISWLENAKEPATICATGPLTNLALVLQQRPDLAASIGRLVLMGGCPFPEPLRGQMGNYTPPGATGLAEYNFGVDPEAAAFVLGAGIADITMIGLNVTRSVLYGHALDAALRRSGNPVAVASAAIFAAVGEEDIHDYADLHEIPGDPVRAVHDVMAFAWMDRPDLFVTTEAWVKCHGGEGDATPGLCYPVATAAEATTKTPIRLAVSVDGEGFKARMAELLGGYNGYRKAA